MFQKTDMLDRQQEKNRSLPSEEKVSGSECAAGARKGGSEMS
jgi:hypothetical protein